MHLLLKLRCPGANAGLTDGPSPSALGKCSHSRQAPEPGLLNVRRCVTSVWETQARPIVVQHPFGLLRASVLVQRPHDARRKSSSGKRAAKGEAFRATSCGLAMFECRPCMTVRGCEGFEVRDKGQRPAGWLASGGQSRWAPRGEEPKND